MASAQSIVTARATQAELARQLNVSRQAVNDLVRRNILEVGQDGRIDTELARVALANRVRPSAKTASAATPAPPPATTAANDAGAQADATSVTSFHVAKTLRETAEARIAQLKLAELQGDLIRTDAVRFAYTKRAVALRESILQIPARLAPVLAAESDKAKCHDIIQTELHAVLQQLAEA